MRRRKKEVESDAGLLEKKHGRLSSSLQLISLRGEHLISLSASFLFIYRPIFILVTRIQTGRGYVMEGEMCRVLACQPGSRSEDGYIQKG